MIATCRRSAISATIGLTLVFGLPAEAQEPASNPVAASSNAFAVDFYKALGARSGNLFFSPIDIEMAFSMAYSGAGGQTAAEMRKVLHITGTPTQNDQATGELFRQMTVETDGAKLAFANAAWVDKRLPLAPDYRQSLETNYSADLPPVDFELAPDRARMAINRWVEDKTAGKIRDLLSAPPKGPMVITSAVYMKADWAIPFKRSDTRTEDFHLSSATKIRAPFMHITERFHYLDAGTFEAVAIPYSGEFSLILLVPKQTEDLARLEAQLSPTALETWLRRLDEGRDGLDVTLALPKFRLDDRIGLDPVLRGLGMKLAFDREKADLSGISAGRDHLFIGAATHQSFVSVDEEGTEAAAATAVEIEVTAFRVRAAKHVTLRADHPFVFLIRDIRSGAIVFMGRLAAPTTDGAN